MDDLIIYNTDDGEANVSLLAKDGTVWCTQAQMAELFNVQKAAISKHLKNLFEDGEVDKNSVVSILETTAADGKKYKVAFYSLDTILAVGFRVRSPRGTQFRRWANSTLKEYLQKGFVLDSERLKNPDGRPDYFDELLAKIRDIRASEKRFYQKLRDLFALSSDYDKTDRATMLFFAETQNKLIYGVTGKTAAELILSRADASQPNMALTSWQGSIVRRKDIYTAKNYLKADELDTLNRLVTIFLESAEFRVKRRKDLTLPFWRSSVDKLLEDHDVPLLASSGKVSRRQMEERVNDIYTAFDARRKKSDAAAADREDLAELEADARLISLEKE
ncbi:MAG: virulence RhuM family protein [Dialister sp.]|nr:virulence RhuM family protein [Dialister sp.]